jgi:histidinol-phosphate aminotransferase
MQQYVSRVVQVRPEIKNIAPYIPGESLEAFVERTGIPIERLVKLNSNENPYGPIPPVLAALANYRHYNHYPDTDATALRRALAGLTGLDERYIVLSHGSNELINLLWHVFLSVGDAIICCPPTFTLYTTITTLCGASVQEVARQPNYDIDVEAILAALTPATKLIVLCSPNNPTGNLLAQADLLRLLETGRIVVVDEAYVEFSEQPRGVAHLVPEYENLVVLRSFSKWAGLAGLRIGYGLFPEWIAGYLRRAQCPFEVNVAGHIAAIETLAHLDCVWERVERIIQERERLFQVLAAQPYLEPVPSQGNFIMARVCDERITVEDIRACVEAHGILLRYFHQPALRNVLRVTVGLPEHTDLLAQALAEVVPGAEARALRPRFSESS